METRHCNDIEHVFLDKGDETLCACGALKMETADDGVVTIEIIIYPPDIPS